LTDLVETTIDFELLERHEYVIKFTFDPDLADIQAQKNELVEKLAPEYSRVCNILGQDSNSKKLKLEKSNIYSYHFRISRLVLLC
jgi:DNA mismatch repair protein MSH2